MNQKQCEAENSGARCTGIEGHPSDHGQYLPGGLVLAPWPNLGSPTGAWSPVALACNACSRLLLMMRKFALGGAEFRCTYCHQDIMIGADGGISQTVIPTLFPSDMSHHLQHEYMAYQVQERRFLISCLRLAGVWDETAAAKAEAEIQPGCLRYLDQIRQPRPRWWRFWQRPCPLCRQDQ